MNGLFDLLDQHAHDRPDARALVVGSDRIPISYGELAALVDDVANRLDRSGLRRGDAVGVVGANNADFVVALLGAARAGLVVAPLDPALPRSELTTRLERSGAQALLVGRPALDAEPVAPLGIPTWNLEVHVAVHRTPAVTLDANSGELRRSKPKSGLSERDALVLFTSGSTAQAKMVPLTHENVAASVRAICVSYELGPDERTCSAGTEGEVWVLGPTVARGYLGNPAATPQSFVVGWFRTGDLGAIDQDGYLFLTGRIKNIINRGGEKISPEHVEDVLAGCRGVTEAAVFAIPDATFGERVGAAVVVSQDERFGSEQILQECRGKLSGFEMPERLEVVAAVPHTAKGALDRRAVEDHYAR